MRARARLSCDGRLLTGVVVTCDACARFTFLANDVWTFYNDTRLVQRQYPHLRAHTAFLIAEAAGVCVRPGSR